MGLVREMGSHRVAPVGREVPLAFPRHDFLHLVQHPRRGRKQGEEEGEEEGPAEKVDDAESISPRRPMAVRHLRRAIAEGAEGEQKEVEAWEVALPLPAAAVPLLVFSLLPPSPRYPPGVDPPPPSTAPVAEYLVRPPGRRLDEWPTNAMHLAQASPFRI